MRYGHPDVVPDPAAPATEAFTAVDFSQLVARYQDAAFAYAFALLKDRAAAEDAAQAAFLTAWVHLKELRDPAAFGGWLRAIVRTHCLRTVRSARIPTVPFDATTPEPEVDEMRTWELRMAL